MRRRFPYLFLFLMWSAPAWAWGPEGHQIVAAIAARELTPAARARVADLLGGEPGVMMVLDSSWADEIRADRPETASWHYVNIEIGGSRYDRGRDCPRDACVVRQMEREEGLLADRRAPRAAKIEALRFLIHFVGDVHQPLHAADRHDKGGNDVMVYWHGQRFSLHRIWDQDVVTALGRDAMTVAAGVDASLTPSQKRQLAGGTPADWADESFRLAGREIYARLPDGGAVDLPRDYPQRESAVTRLQLVRAGLRLAAVLNRLFR